MTPPPTRVWALAAGTVAVTIAAVLATSGTTLAGFTDAATVQAGSTPATAFSSGSVATPATPTTTQQTGSGDTVVTWSATSVSTGAGTTTATAYDVYRYTAATGGTGTLACSTTGALTCTDVKQTATSHYAVRARFADSWVKEGPRRTYAPDATGPAVGFTRPTNGYSNTAANLRSYVNCTNSAPACGTASDAAGVTAVEYTLRVDLDSSSTDYCWNGTGYTATAGACTFAAATGTTAWRLPGTETNAYPNGNPSNLTLTIRATDGFANATTSSITFRMT